MQDKTTTYHPKNRNPAPIKYMAVGAHHDDVEIMATDGILKGQTDNGSFCAVIATDGRGSARSGTYADYSDERMAQTRTEEQKAVAELGRYHSVIFLNHTSASVKTDPAEDVVASLVDVFRTTRPEVLYTHNPFDKHTTHVQLLKRVVEALRRLPSEHRPKLYGVEVWRDLDWLVDADKTVFDVTAGRDLTKAQLARFDSQVAGGKRYDLATEGRRLAHATYFESHDVDAATQLVFAIDMSALMEDDALSLETFAKHLIDRFKDDVLERIRSG